jgi:triosephosphate isomerase
MIGGAKKPLIAGNWKLNMTIPEARHLIQGVLAAAEGLPGVEFLVIPTFTSLAEARRLLEGTAVRLGAQDMFWEDQGAYTGEVSGPLLRDAGCSHVIIGHSERRQNFGETDETVNRKIRAALRSGLTPVVCIGETDEEREAGRTEAKIDRQLEAGLKGLSADEAARVILAYEPIWAIGTGKTATPAQAEGGHAHIRARLRDKYGKDLSGCVIILYGGSAKPANAFSLFKEKDIDGFLVGGASLEAESFIGIAREALRADKEKK